MNRLSNEYVDYKPVKMLLFRNLTEAEITTNAEQ